MATDSLPDEERGFYRVEKTDDPGECLNCKQHCAMWTIVFNDGDDPTEIGQSWGDREMADDICDLMNMAFEAGLEHVVNNAEEEKLVAFFRSPEGDKLGREGDYDNLSPAETAIRAMRKVLT